MPPVYEPRPQDEHLHPLPFLCRDPHPSSALPFCSPPKSNRNGSEEREKDHGGRGIVRGAEAEADGGEQEEAGGAAAPPPLRRRPRGRRRQALAGGQISFFFCPTSFLSAAAVGVR
jgi:hypothetical protein